MNHAGTVTLETNRLTLRRFRPEDAPAMYENWAKDPEVSKFLSWPAHSSPEVSQAVIEQWIADYESLDKYEWCIELKSISQPIGSISAVHVYEKTESVEIGYCIGKTFWGQGIMSEALAALIDFFFDRVGVNRVEAKHDPQNPGSGRVMEKCGLRREGCQRQALRSNRGITDVVLYGLVREDRGKQA